MRQRGRLHALVDVELPVRQLPTRLGERQPNQRRAVVASERIRLRGPVHVAERRGEAVEVVLRPLVVGDDDLFGGHLGPTLIMFSNNRVFEPRAVLSFWPMSSSTGGWMRSNS